MIVCFPSRSAWHGLICCVLASLPCLAGCTLLHLSALPNDKDTAVATNVPQLPGKYSQRVSQFVFVSDFQLQTDQPLFRELADMREQVIKDLRLPTPNSLITV